MDCCSIGSCNVRGLNNKGKQESVLEFCNVNKIGVGGLLETKLKGNKVQELMDNKFTTWEFYNSPIVEGRLLIIWRKSFVRVLVIAESAQHVHCVVKMAGKVNAFCLTFVYGFNAIEDRKILWYNLMQLSFPVSPWLILGDFNSVFFTDDRSGGNPISHSEMVDSNLWLAQSNVVALKRFGSNFTWTNNQVGSSRIYSKIDHAFVNEEWHDFFPNTAARFSWEATSDHCSCVISASATESIGIKPFRFFNFWADHHDFKTIVEQSWKRPVTSRGLKGIYIKLMRVKHCLKKFNHEVIGDIGKRFQDAKSSFSEAKLQAFMGSNSTVNSKMNLSCIEQGTKISLDQQVGLLKPFSVVEIKKAMFSIPDTKSPGPDGFGSGIFKSMWPVIGGEVCAAVVNFFETGFMPPEFHNTTISLIPKLENPTRALDYRPIACCSTIYKCISKLLCSRLASVLPSLVHQN
ncbi:uncharacterized protein LOC133795366 [Humulus lupulus]|uniref:uncharacterized protein LOC133795366 n=1 Tax=Humulus lupulus TaxID=3486 RepID=UPI002B415AF7|nr:uncharacterized protein LOC133795366 [Humulus lupulus]